MQRTAARPPARSPRRSSRQERLQPRRAPRQARARARVEAILSATVALLATHDVDEISTAAIARRARVPIGSVYSYFPSKEGVLAELIARTTARIDEASTAVLARDLDRLPWQAAIERTIDRAVLAYRADAAYLAAWRAMRGTPVFREVASASDERFASALEALPTVSGRVRPLALRAAIRIANTFLDWLLDTQDPRGRARIVREMKRALIAYLAPEFGGVRGADSFRGATDARRPG